jgi:hypothetical protein
MQGGPVSDQIEFHDATVSDFLYVLRNEAGQAADRLQKQVIDMRKALGEAERVLDRLNGLADDAQDAAELVCASDLEPTAHADIPERSGLTRKDTQ